MDKMFRWKTRQCAMILIASAPVMETWHLLHLLRFLIRTVVDGTMDKILRSIPRSNMCVALISWNVVPITLNGPISEKATIYEFITRLKPLKAYIGTFIAPLES